MIMPELPPPNPAPAMDLDQFDKDERAVSIRACENYARLYALAYGERVRQECAKACDAIDKEEQRDSPYYGIAKECAAAIRGEEK